MRTAHDQILARFARPEQVTSLVEEFTIPAHCHVDVDLIDWPRGLVALNVTRDADLVDPPAEWNWPEGTGLVQASTTEAG